VDGYVNDLKALGRSADHVRHVDKRLRRLMRECHWQNLREVTADAFLRWRAEQTQAPKTINEYHAVLSALFTWLRKQNRVPANPFEIISKVDTRGKQRFQRRALNDDEAKRLLATPRKLLYLLAMHTGLRRGEINASCMAAIFIWIRTIRIGCCPLPSSRIARNSPARCILNWWRNCKS
jgi:integrase